MKYLWLTLRGLALAIIVSILTAQSAMAFLPACDTDKPLLNMDGLVDRDTDGTENGLAATFRTWQRGFLATRGNDTMCSAPAELATEGTCFGRCDESDIDTLIQYN
jgi:hypothetical protein